MTLTFKNGSYLQPKGVNVSAAFFGSVKGVRFLDTDQSSGGRVPIWASVLAQLTSYSNYVDDVDIRAATYDWRLGPEALLAQNYVEHVKSLIVEMSAASGGARVVLVSLSEGGPLGALTLSRLDAAFKKKFIRGFVSLSGAFGGIG